MDVKSVEQSTNSGKRLACLIDDLGLRKDRLAAKAGIHPTVISMLLVGHRKMTPYYAGKLAPLLGVTSGYLLGMDEMPAEAAS